MQKYITLLHLCVWCKSLTFKCGLVFIDKIIWGQYNTLPCHNLLEIFWVQSFSSVNRKKQHKIVHYYNYWKYCSNLYYIIMIQKVVFVMFNAWRGPENWWILFVVVWRNNIITHKITLDSLNKSHQSYDQNTIWHQNTYLLLLFFYYNRRYKSSVVILFL